MNATDLTTWVAAAAWGLLLGWGYFYGLWRTLAALPARRRPRRWLAVSYALRSAAALLGFWLVLRIDSTGFFLTVAGFFAMRSVLTRRLGRPPGERAGRFRGMSVAPASGVDPAGDRAPVVEQPAAGAHRGRM